MATSLIYTNVDHLNALKRDLRKKRKEVVIWSKPLTTLFYFTMEIGHLIAIFLSSLWRRRLITTTIISIIGSIVYVLTTTTSPELQFVAFKIKEAIFWCILGILSSVGLGTGLHTFILFLGPYIAQVTMHAYSCGTLDFGSQLDSTRQNTWSSIQCPEDGLKQTVTILAVLSKVRFPAMMWGAGTAIGELPPYFVARAARLSGEDPDDEDLEEFHESLKQQSKSFIASTKRFVHDLVQRAGFWGIFACAAIPNPLFDLAGITCGHFLVPFRTFFTATVLGKAVVKVHFQVLLLITLMSKPIFDALVNKFRNVPVFGNVISNTLLRLRARTEAKYMHGETSNEPTNWLAVGLAMLVIGMVVGFLLSIINQLAQKNMHRRDRAHLLAKAKSEDL
eukprot:gene5042-134_t